MNDSNKSVDSAYERIWEDLITLKIQPGKRINIEQLKKRYNIGTSPIREALCHLLNTGMIAFLPNKGYLCTPMSVENMNSIYTCRIELEPIAVIESIKRSDDNWIESVAQAFSSLDEIIQHAPDESTDECIIKIIRATRVLTVTAHYPARDLIVTPITKELQNAHDRYLYILLKTGPLWREMLSEVARENNMLRDAFLNRDTTLASSIITNFFKINKNRLNESYRKDSLITHVIEPESSSNIATRVTARLTAAGDMDTKKLAIELAYDAIWKDLISLKIEPGKKINISELKKRYDMGLGSVREALSQLIKTRMITFTPNKGYYCVPMDAEKMNNIFACRLILEPIAIAKSIQTGDDEWLSNVVASIYKCKSMLEKTEDEMSDVNIINYIRSMKHLQNINRDPVKDLIIFQIASELQDAADRYTFLHLKNKSFFYDSSAQRRSNFDDLQECFTKRKSMEACELVTQLMSCAQQELNTLYEEDVID